jgi:hypothetical protein
MVLSVQIRLFPPQWNRSSVVEHTADNRAVTSSSLVGSTWDSTLVGGYDGIRGGSIPSLGNGSSILPYPYSEDWQSG